MTTAEVRLSAYLQGPWRGVLGAFGGVDDSRAAAADESSTTANVPPAAARGLDGVPLPSGTFGLLAQAPYPQTPALPDTPAEHRLGHLLVAALGLQRREPSNRFNDHRTVASVRSMFPVHVFVLSADGALAYVDLYRHALINLPGKVTADGNFAALLPAAGNATLLLAGRYTDLPAGYSVLRSPLCLLELGIALRSLHVAADLVDVRLQVRFEGAAARAADLLLAETGPGVWTPPLVVNVDGVAPTCASGPLPGAVRTEAAQFAEADLMLNERSLGDSVRADRAAAALLVDLSRAPVAPVRGTPESSAGTLRTAPPSWSEVLWNRTAGRAPAHIGGLSVRPAVLGEECLAEMLDWLGRPAPAGVLAEVGGRVRVTVALQRLAGLTAGRYTWTGGRLELDSAEPGLMQQVEDGWGYPLTAFRDCGLRHANAMWVFSADVDAILDEFGPVGWSLLQLWCGWVSHGLASAAAVHGLFARPARSFDEFRLQYALGLPRELVPAFTVTCGRSRFAEPMLDLRT